LTGSLAALGSGALMWWSATQTAAWQQWPLALPLFFVALLSLATLGNQLMAGLFHGVRKSLPLAQVTMACTLVAIALCWPAATFGGIVGSLTLATAAVAAPGLILVGLALSDPNRTPPTSGPALRKEVLAQWFKSTPTVASTLIRNGVNWFCSIYLVQQYHGPAGVGIVTIGLQWMMLMQLPTLAWGGRMVADMATAQQQSADDMARVTRLWLVKCAWTTALLGLVVAAASPVLAHLYRLHDSPLPWVLAANALVSLCMAATFVLERTFFCQCRQRTWFALSLAGDAAQLALTFAFAHHSVVVMSLSSLCSALLVFIGGQWLLTRHHPLHASKS